MNINKLLPVLLAVGAGLIGLVLKGYLPYLTILLVVAVVMAVAVLMAYINAKSDEDLLKKLLHFAAQLESGVAPAPVETTRKDLMGELANGLNRLTNRDKAVQQANSDPLTGLANRRGMVQKLDHALKGGKELALFYIDLDKFKPINDQYGHEMGDAVLRKVAEFLTACVRDGDVVARLGGDEFVLIFFNLTDKALLTERAQKVLTLLNEPFWVGETRIKIGGSVGITVAPADGATTDAILNAADETMYAVKKAGKNNFRFYS
ncbi:MAG TPA: GGDEF domain-containing protein [Alphaproteobacteria bacterium]|nr:GGDEF domain-containing protein [Alphaproteobacteria bacterium]